MEEVGAGRKWREAAACSVFFMDELLFLSNFFPFNIRYLLSILHRHTQRSVWCSSIFIIGLYATLIINSPLDRNMNMSAQEPPPPLQQFDGGVLRNRSFKRRDYRSYNCSTALSSLNSWISFLVMASLSNLPCGNPFFLRVIY